jgi:hypothetical protein
MFIRWKHRRLRRDPDTLRYAELVRSVRVDGRPRQQIVRYLGSIHERYCTAPAHRQAFWHWVECRLRSLALDPAVRQALERQLAQCVPRPTGEEQQEVLAQQAALRRLQT